MKTLLTASPSGSTEGWQGIGPICGIPSAAVGDATSDDATSNRVPTAAIRHALRALASETGQLTGLRGVKLLRPLVAQAHELLRDASRRAVQSRPICAAGRVLRTAR